jgi:hypothetical protein
VNSIPVDPLAETSDPLIRPQPTWIGIVVLVVAALLVGAFTFSAVEALRPGQSFGHRMVQVFFAALLLILPARVVWVGIRRRVRTGSWSVSPEERRANLTKAAATRPLPRWLDFTFPILFVLIAAINLRKSWNSHLQGLDLFYATFWIAFAVYSVWSAFRQFKRKNRQ